MQEVEMMPSRAAAEERGPGQLLWLPHSSLPALGSFRSSRSSRADHSQPQEAARRFPHSCPELKEWISPIPPPMAICEIRSFFLSASDVAYILTWQLLRLVVKSV